MCNHIHFFGAQKDVFLCGTLPDASQMSPRGLPDGSPRCLPNVCPRCLSDASPTHLSQLPLPDPQPVHPKRNILNEAIWGLAPESCFASWSEYLCHRSKIVAWLKKATSVLTHRTKSPDFVSGILQLVCRNLMKASFALCWTRQLV